MRYDLKRLFLLMTAACGLLAFLVIHGWWAILVIWIGFCIAMMLLAVWKQRARYLVAAFIAFPLGIVIVPLYLLEGHTISMLRLSRVAPGMPSAEVERVLGPPQTKQLDCWQYSGATWCHVDVWFAPDGRVERVVHDH